MAQFQQLPPGLRGLLAAEQMANQRNMTGLQMTSGLLGLQGQYQQQQQAAQQQRELQNLIPQLTDPAAQALARAGDFRGAVTRQFPQPQGPLVMAPGSVAVDRQDPSRVLFSAPSAPAKPSGLTLLMQERDALPMGDPRRALYDAAIAKSTSHAPAPNVSVKVDNKMGESFAKEVGPMMAESRAGASAAIGTVDAANRISAALEQGNVVLGPGATIRNKADQFAQVLGVTGKDTEERLVNTRNVIRGLSQFAVSARKALKGQGQVSDYEGRLIQRAEAGEIDDFTLPELRDFVGVTRKLAEQQYGEHQRNLDVMRQNPALSGLVPFYGVPELPKAPTPQRRGSDRTPRIRYDEQGNRIP